jgi:hypothetical protein
MSVILALVGLALGQTKPSVVVRLNKPMVSEVAVSKAGRIFLSFPRWDDPVDSTLMEVSKGQLVAYPNAAFNRLAKRAAATRLVNVRGITIDSQDRLWALDSGSLKMGSTIPDGPKLVCLNLATNKLERIYRLPQNVAFPTSFLSNVRIDLGCGKAGYAILTDASLNGPNGFIVVDLDSGDSWRRLSDHPSTKADPAVIPVVEGKRVINRPPVGPEIPIRMGINGLALDPAKGLAYFCPLMSRHLYSVSLDALVDRAKVDSDVVASLVDLGEKGISDGLETDLAGNLFVTDIESNTVKRRNADGTFANVMRFSNSYWVDSISVQNGELFATGSEWHRRALLNKGKDNRKHRYVVAKIPL